MTFVDRVKDSDSQDDKINVILNNLHDKIINFKVEKY